MNKGFIAGTGRLVLNAGSLAQNNGSYYTKALSDWLEDTLLIPKVEGLDWAGFADKLRKNNIQLSTHERWLTCKNLARLIFLLEQNGLSHRDMSSGNVFIVPEVLEISLIDFDSMFHSSWDMPHSVPLGSEGYTAPFIWQCSVPKGTISWCPCADRFALTILCVEFLLMGPKAALTGEGGMFEQKELCARSGKGLTHIKMNLDKCFPQVTTKLCHGPLRVLDTLHENRDDLAV